MIGKLFSDYAWYELWSPGYLIAIAFIAYFYLSKIVIPCKDLNRNQIRYFFIAIVLLFLMKGTPFAIIATNFFSAHIFGLMMMLFIIPPLLILGIPVVSLRSFFWSYRKRQIMRIFTHPWVTAILFNAGLSVYLVPMFFNTVHESSFLTLITELLLFTIGCLMWWTIISPLPEIAKLSEFARVAYVFLTSLLLMPIGIYLLISSEPQYSFYSNHWNHALTPLADQQLGGGFLKGIQLTAYGIALFLLMSQWSRKDEEAKEENTRIVQGIVIQLPSKK